MKALRITGGVIYFIALGGAVYCYGWELAIIITLFAWASNIERHIAIQKELQ